MKLNRYPLIKTQNMERIKYLQCGTLYCNKLSYFRALENNDNDCIKGDSFEAMLPIRNGYLYCPETNEVQFIKEELISTTWSDDYVFCMSSIRPRSITKEGVSLISGDIEELGTESLIIHDTDGFIDLVKQAAENNGYKIEHGFVQYYDDHYDNLQMIASLVRGISNIAFWKRKIYEGQSEYRFVFHGEAKSSSLELPLGQNLNCISTIINTEKLKHVKIRKES